MDQQGFPFDDLVADVRGEVERRLSILSLSLLSLTSKTRFYQFELKFPRCSVLLSAAASDGDVFLFQWVLDYYRLSFAKFSRALVFAVVNYSALAIANGNYHFCDIFDSEFFKRHVRHRPQAKIGPLDPLPNLLKAAAKSNSVAAVEYVFRLCRVPVNGNDLVHLIRSALEFGSSNVYEKFMPHLELSKDDRFALCKDAVLSKMLHPVLSVTEFDQLESGSLELIKRDCIQYENLELMRFLILRSFSFEKVEYFESAIVMNNTAMVDILLQQGHQLEKRHLEIAACAGKVQMLSHLCKILPGAGSPLSTVDPMQLVYFSEGFRLAIDLGLQVKFKELVSSPKFPFIMTEFVAFVISKSVDCSPLEACAILLARKASINTNIYSQIVAALVALNLLDIRAHACELIVARRLRLIFHWANRGNRLIPADVFPQIFELQYRANPEGKLRLKWLHASQGITWHLKEFADYFMANRQSRMFCKFLLRCDFKKRRRVLDALKGKLDTRELKDFSKWAKD